MNEAPILEVLDVEPTFDDKICSLNDRIGDFVRIYCSNKTLNQHIACTPQGTCLQMSLWGYGGELPLDDLHYFICQTTDNWGLKHGKIQLTDIGGTFKGFSIVINDINESV